VMPDMKDYLDFVLKLFFAFGIAFEVPIATILLCWMGTTTPDSLREKRAYVIVGAFVIGMLLTPPDMISQTLLAIPMWLLFEAGILFAPFFMPKEDEEDDNGDDDPDSGKTTSAPQPAPATSPSSEQPTEENTKKPFDPTEFKSDYLAPTDNEMEAELDRIEAEEDEAESSDTSSSELDDDAAESTSEEPLDEAAQAREDRARKQAQREADNIRMDHYESPISERYGELDAESERALDEELELMDGGDYDDDAEEFDEESEKDPSEQK